MPAASAVAFPVAAGFPAAVAFAVGFPAAAASAVGFPAAAAFARRGTLGALGATPSSADCTSRSRS